MPQLILRSVSAQPLVELVGADASGAASRLVVCAGQLEIAADERGGPARLEGVLRFLVPGAPTLPSSSDASRARLSVTAYPLGITPIAINDARLLVVGARAALVPEGGALALAVEVALEGLYLAPPAAARVGWQLTATLPLV
ncbi:MAG: hypothetical protein R3A48_07880 [Polyangiales bacterium]